MTIARARRIALAAQGFTGARPAGRVDVRHFRRVLTHLGAVQIDSVNVVSRSHYLPFFSRLGGYDRSALDRYTSHSGEVFEYWGHEASLLPVEDYSLLRFRMDELHPWHRVRRILEEQPGYVEAVYDEISERGPLTVSELEDPGSRTGPWWGYGKGKIALEWLFAKGRITAWRNATFTRVYDVTERVIPSRYLEGEAPDRDEAYRALLLRAARHHGIGTADDLADYYRLHIPTSRGLLDNMAAAGLLEEVEVDGWKGPVYLHPEAVVPRTARGTALLSPFDSLVWHRDRAERLFGFRYRIEIYVPKPKREYGYYVLPFLLDGELVSRVDVKALRQVGALEVRGAYVEEGHDPGRVAAAMFPELEAMATWLGMGEIEIVNKGNLAANLRAWLV